MEFVAIGISLFGSAYLYYCYFKRVAKTFCLQKNRKVLRCVIGAGLLASIAVLSWLTTTTVAVIIYLLCFIGVEFVSIVFLRFLRRKKTSDTTPVYERIYQTGILPLVCTVLVVAIGSIYMMNISETEYDIYTKAELPDGELTVVCLADIHYGNSVNAQILAECVEKINEEEPDMVLLVGDIVDESTKHSEMQEAFSILADCESTYGTYFVYGNHDKAEYTTNATFSEEELEQALEEAGITALADETLYLDEHVVLVGRKDKTMIRLSEKELLAELPEEDFVLLMDHQPVALDELGQYGVDVSVSGHTHNGQLWPCGLFCRIVGINENEYGLENRPNGLTAITTSGLSGWGCRVRTEGKSEYVVLHIYEKK